MEREPTFRATRRVAIATLALVALIASFLGVHNPPTAQAQNASPTLEDTARLLGYLWADGSYDNGVWDATGPSGGRELIQHLVIKHGGTWVDQSQLVFTLPAPYDWAEWKDGLPNDDARTRSAVRDPGFLAAVLEGEGSTGGLVYDQTAASTAGFKQGRLNELLQLLRDRGFSTASYTNFPSADSGRIDIGAAEFAELRASHRFACPTVANAVRLPGGQNYRTYGAIQWLGAGAYSGVVRTDCVQGQQLVDAGVPAGDCVLTSDGNGRLRVSWTYKRGTVSIRRNGTFVTAVSAVERAYVDAPAAGSYSYEVRVAADGQRSDSVCGSANTADPFVAPPNTGAKCMGRPVTHIGTSGADTIRGTAGNDVIHAFGGDDEIFGLQGNDIICAGSGDDTVHAGKGNDVVWGEGGFDVLYGAQGNDELRAANANRTDTVGSRMFGGQGDDTIHGTNRWDRMQGGPGNDVLFGYEGRDWMRGGGDNDQIMGGGNIDDIYSGNGNDFIEIEGNDTVRAGAGADGCLYITAHNNVISCEARLTNATKARFINSLG